MHMADALLSPATGAAMWAVSAGIIAYCSHKVRTEMNTSQIPLMGVLGAFIFAAQMINFAIPVTGSSGHLGGGLILAIMLGPYAAFLTIASVLVVQALFFADGGLLALGCNIFNLGFFPAFIAYPLVYKKIAGNRPTARKITVASIIAAITGLQMGAFSVVLETSFSGVSSLPFSNFVALMQPIHLLIGTVEGMATASVVAFVYQARPDIMHSVLESRPTDSHHPVRNVILAFLALALVMGGFVSQFASTKPDGLEWSIKKVTGQKELKSPERGLHAILNTLQEKTAFWPGYSLKKTAEAPNDPQSQQAVHTVRTLEELKDTPSINVEGLVGGTLTLILSFLTGFVLKIWKRAP